MRKPKYKIRLQRMKFDSCAGPVYKVVRMVGLESFQTDTSNPAVNHRIGSGLSAKQVQWLTKDTNFEVTIVA